MKPKEIKYAAAALLIATIYFASFGFLIFYRPSSNFLGNFLFDVIKVLMGAGVLGLITGLMFFFQARIEGSNEKKAKVFDQKISFYNEVIDKFEKMLQDGSIDEKEEHEALFMVVKSILVSSPEASDALATFFESVSNNKGDLEDSSKTDEENIYSMFIDFLIKARADLDVQEQVSDGDKERYKKLQKSVVDATEKMKKYYWPPEKKREIIDKYDAAPRGMKGAVLKGYSSNRKLQPSDIKTWKDQIGY